MVTEASFSRRTEAALSAASWPSGERAAPPREFTTYYIELKSPEQLCDYMECPDLK
jgi:hypothetical protein